MLVQPVVEPGPDAVDPARVREEGREHQRVDAERGDDAPRPVVPCRPTQRADDLSVAPPGRTRLPCDRDHEEAAGDEHRDERGLLGREAEREQRAEDRRVTVARAVEEAEGDDEHRERDGGDVDVLAREAREVQVRRADGEEGGGGERRDAAQLSPQAVEQRNHQRAHQRGGEARREVRVPEQHEVRGRQVEAERAVQQRVVGVVAGLLEQPGEVGVLALVVVERARAEVDQPQRERDRHERDPRDQLAARAPGDRGAQAVPRTGPRLGELSHGRRAVSRGRRSAS